MDAPGGYRLLDFILGSVGPRSSCGWDSAAGLPGWDAPGPGGVWPSDLGDACPTGRSVYLRRRLGLARRTRAMDEGARAHEAALSVWRMAVEGGWEGLGGAAREALDSAPRGFLRGVLWAVASAARWLSVGGVPPVSVEPKLPGWAGFSGGRPDLLVGTVPVELAASSDARYLDRKRVALAAYALMAEAAFGVPVPYGYLVSLSDGGVERVCMDPRLRARAVSEAERLHAALDGDPGLPVEGPGACPESCPFNPECWGGALEGRRGEAGVEAGA